MQVSHNSPFLCSIIAAAAIFLGFPAVGFSIQCYECHGTKDPVDFRPVDAPYRNITTGGFLGNHRTHTSTANPLIQCEFCHSGSSAYNQGHLSGNIDISKNINNSRVRALYKNLTSPWPQTSTPEYGTCTNVNCHFENETLTWGSAPFTVPGNCGGCHGFPPMGGNTGAEGSHLAPGHLMGADIDSCGHCHPRHTGFTHATSVRRPLLVTPGDPSFARAGNYDGLTNDYLPLQDNQFGKCNNIYCHSNGVSAATGPINDNNTPVWGGAPLNCGSCHSYPPDYANGSLKTNSHARHAEYGFTCSRCHYSTTSDDTTIRNWKKHISKFYNISSQQERLTYTFAANGGTCSNGYCHSNGTSVSTGAIPANNVKWGNASLSCSSCHANPPSYTNGNPKTNSHAKHAGYGYGCNKCHSATTSDGVTITTLAKHANGTYDLSPGGGASFNYLYAPTGGTCSSNTCHSDGSVISSGRYSSNSNAKWGKKLGCTGCHSFPPGYVNGSTKANSHKGKHTGYYCDSCHVDTTDGFVITDPSKHGNNIYNVSNIRMFDSYTYNPAGGTCTNVQCHVNRQGYRRWGADKCDECHGAPPNTPSHTRHFSGTPAQASYTSVGGANDSSSGYLFNCGTCHPIDINKHGNGTVEIELYNSNAPAGSIKADQRQAGASYENGMEPFKDERGFRYTNGTCSNVYCHSYTNWATPGVENCLGDYSTCSVPAQASLLQNGITRVYREVSWNGTLPNNCTGCHANGPRTTYATNYGSTGDNHSWINDDFFEEGHFGKYYVATEPISCTFCHNSTVNQLNSWSRPVITDPYYNPTASEPYFTTMSSVPVSNFAKHVNGKVDVAFDRNKVFTVNFPGSYTYPPKTTFYRMSTSTYSPETKTCSNVSCHLGQTSVKWGTTYKAYQYKNGEFYGCDKCHDANHPYSLW